MEIKLQKCGNSVGIRIPSSVLKSFNLKENDMIDVDDGILVAHKR